MQKPAKGLFLRGWVTTDGKKTWLPHFAKLRDPDPTFETYQPVILEKTRGKKDCRCPCYCDEITPISIHLEVPRTPTNINLEVPSPSPSPSPPPSPGAVNHLRLVTAAIRHILPKRPDGVEKTKRLEVLDILAEREHEGLYCLILFNGAQTKSYKGFYEFDRMRKEISRLHGEGPKEIDESMIGSYYSFNSATKRFDKVRTFNILTIHGFTLSRNIGR